MMRSIVPTRFASQLQALGLDPSNLPQLEALSPRALRGVMGMLAQSLDLKCRDCHVEGAFAAPTRRKKIAAHMWDDFVARLAFSTPASDAGATAPEGGALLDAGPGPALFCDSCHQGRTVLLDRSDKKVLSAWMDANFVSPLVRRDGQDHGCETCHVNMEMHFLDAWSK